MDALELELEQYRLSNQKKDNLIEAYHKVLQNVGMMVQRERLAPSKTY